MMYLLTCMQLFIHIKYEINTYQALLNACQVLIDLGLIAQVLAIMGLDILGTTRSVELLVHWSCHLILKDETNGRSHLDEEDLQGLGLVVNQTCLPHFE